MNIKDMAVASANVVLPLHIEIEHLKTEHAAEVARLQGECESNLKSAQYSAETNRKIVKTNAFLSDENARLNEQLLHLRADRDEWERKATSNFEECAKMDEQVQALAAENAALKESRAVLAENSLETCNAIYCAGYRNEDTQRGLMQSTGNGNKYPNPIKSLVDEALRPLETPATTAILNEVRAQGADSVRDYHKERYEALRDVDRNGSNHHAEAMLCASDVAARIRKGGKP